jgi:hypothetical protein
MVLYLFFVKKEKKIKANLYLEKRKDFQKMLFSAFY